MIRVDALRSARANRNRRRTHVMNRRFRQDPLTWMLIASVLFVGACKAKPAAEPSGFLAQNAKLEKQELYPFHKVWFSPKWNDPGYRSLVVQPVNTEFVKQSSWWSKANLKGGKMEEDLAELAEYTRNEFAKKFREDDEKRFTVVDEARSDSLVLELALVDVIPNKASLGALGLAATVVAAPAGAAIAAKESAKGSVAIEGRFRDARSGEVVAMWADREAGKFGPINLRRATWYGEAHKIIQEWADQWVRIANAEPGEKVKDTRTFTLMPW
jgi:hypothetical protein